MKKTSPGNIRVQGGTYRIIEEITPRPTGKQHGIVRQGVVTNSKGKRYLMQCTRLADREPPQWVLVLIPAEGRGKTIREEIMIPPETKEFRVIKGHPADGKIHFELDGVHNTMTDRPENWRYIDELAAAGVSVIVETTNQWNVSTTKPWDGNQNNAQR